MTILKVIHGYPPQYSAGSEVYSQTICRELARRGHSVHVFTREEVPIANDFVCHDELQDGVTLHFINNPRNKDRFCVKEIDEAFDAVLERVHPDIVHFGHLSHLSLNLVSIAKRRGYPVLFTLHDFWLLCPRGQFLKVGASTRNPYLLCSKCVPARCAKDCYSRFWTGASDADDEAYWTSWVEKRQDLAQKVLDDVDLFHAPSRQLMDIFVREHPQLKGKAFYLDYGFDRRRFAGRNRKTERKFVFGYIGTHIPAKGIGLLVKAFKSLPQNACLRIWGRPNGENTAALKRMAVGADVQFMGGYSNEEILPEVFNNCDAIVVPSIWLENSPLVIHEAQQARVPVITADVGGMAEYVHHGVNGLLFKHRDEQSLAEQMAYLMANPNEAAKLGRRGYLGSEDGQIPTIEEHVGVLVGEYESLVQKQGQERGPKGPWRITFDTNPDICNRQCIMCERHSQVNRARLQSRLGVMDAEIVRKTVQEMVPLGLKEIIPSTMGEPLLYRDFDVFIEMCKKYGIRLNLTTNGTFPGSRGAEGWARVLVPITTDVKISWNGATKEVFERIMPGGAGFEASIENLKTFVSVRDELAMRGENRCRVTLQLTFMKANMREIPTIVRMAILHGIDRVKGHHLIVTSPEVEKESVLRDKSLWVEWNQIMSKCREYARQHPDRLGKNLLLANFSDLDAVRVSSRGRMCPFLGREAWINERGEFSPCCYPDEERRKLGLTKNLRNGGLKALWESDVFWEFRERFPSHPVCQRCSLRR